MKRRADNDLPAPPKKRRRTDDDDDDDDDDNEEDMNDIQQSLKHTNIALCKFNCNRSVAPGRTRTNNLYDTCCRECAVSKGTTTHHDHQCDARNPQTINNNNDNDNDVDIMIDDLKNDESDDDEIGELYDNGYDNPDYRSSLIWEIHSKENWEKKILNENILTKWKKESLKYGMPTQQFDKTIDIMVGMMNKDKLLVKRKKNQYYSSDSDVSVQTDAVINPYDHGVVGKVEQECVGKHLGDALRNYIENEIEGKMKEVEKDWHPNTNKMVLDLVHPSLYCYVSGESVLIESSLNKKIKSFIKEQNKAAKDSTRKINNWFWRNRNNNNNNNNDDVPTQTEKYQFQWLPSEFMINRSNNGNNVQSVEIKSYINNLDRLKHAKLYTIIGDIFGKFVPLFDEVLHSKLPSECQVIVKLANIFLDCNNGERMEYDGGSWHIEGTEYEHIICAGVYYYDIENIKGSYLQFREEIDEYIDYEQGDVAGVFETYGLRDEDPLNKYLGKVTIDETKCIAFPNTLQHRVTKFKLKDLNKNGKRKILVFFVIDPKHKIISTQNVPFQQTEIMKNYLKNILKKQTVDGIIDIIADFMPCFKLKQAKQNREKLMFVRKYIVKEQNEEIYERPFSLCEH